MFSDTARSELECSVIVVATSSAARVDLVERICGASPWRKAEGAFVIASDRRFLGQGVRLALTAIDPDQLARSGANADVVIALDASSLIQARKLAADRPGSVCLMIADEAGRPQPEQPWEVRCEPEALLRRCLDEFLSGVEAGRVNQEVRLSDPSTREALTTSARLEVLGHLQAQWGECVQEFNSTRPASRPYWFVVECAPTPGRPFWSYGTVGLSLAPQLPTQAPRIEVVAYSPQRAPQVPGCLLGLCRVIDSASPDDFPVKSGDTIELEGPGLERAFGLVPAPEDDSFHEFPSEGVSAFGMLAEGAKVAFLQLVPLSDRECAEARVSGAVEVVARLGRTGARRAEGWPGLEEAPARKWWKFWG